MEVKIKIEGMSCGHCSKAVHNVIAELPGVQNAKVDLDSASAVVEFDEKVISPERIVEAVNQTHYSASL